MGIQINIYTVKSVQTADIQHATEGAGGYQ